MDKTAIKKFAVWAREKLIEDISYKAGLLGISDKGIAEELPQSTNDLKFFDIGTKEYVEVSGKEIKQRDALVSAIRKKERDTKSYKEAYEFIIEEVAYTWFNRLIAIRFMEVNDYLPSGIRVLSSEDKAKKEPDFVTNPFEADLDLTPFEQEKVIQLKEQNKSDELFRMLFIKQCNNLNEILPDLFEKTSDYTELFLTISFTDTDGVVYKLVHDINEDDFNIDKEDGQVEIIGWLYQYYISKKHDKVVSIKKGTIKKADIPAATQVFTTDWVVRYMVDNSLGRYWIERNTNSKLAEKLEFFVTPKDGKINYIDEKIYPTDLTFFDPCMGSGHILVYAFDVLMEIYRECGYSDRDAALNIVQHNLYGMDIDKRAYQLAYFVIMMKARSYNRRALTQDSFNNLAIVEESNSIDKFTFEGLTNDIEQNKIGEYLVSAFKDAQEIGTLQTIKEEDYGSFRAYLENLSKDKINADMFSSVWLKSVQPLMLTLTKQAIIMSKKYCVVCTNPPYMNKLEGQLKKFVTDNYKAYSSDLFSVFMYRNFDFCKKDAYSAFMTPFVWMFIEKYEKLRDYIVSNKSITSLVQMEYSAFEEATVPICAFILKNRGADNKVLCFRLSDFKGGMEVQKQKVLEAQLDKECGYYYEADKGNFKKIPGTPIAYWASDRFINIFEEGTKLGDIADSKVGLQTADNDRFLRLWYEVNNSNIKFDAHDREEASSTNKKWFPYNKGGEFRKWYGNNDYVVNWENDGFEIRNFYDDKGKLRSRPQNMKYYFRESVSWSDITSSSNAFRYKSKGNLFDVTGMSLFSQDNLMYLLGLCNTPFVVKVLEMIAPTIHCQCGDVAKIPVIIDNGRKLNVEEMTKENIEISKTDWNLFEISWDFTVHPLVKRNVSSVKEAYEIWEKESSERFQLLKSNEEELNRIFIDIYGLKDELTPEVEDKDITVRKADLQRDIKSLISYAVGCMFGRYSLSEEGLIYAGGEWNSEKYKEFAPDDDNCIPVTDEEYFEDDIVGRFCEFIKIVFGEEDLETNLKYIANALGNKGTTSRDVIRNYFLRDFIKDHIKIYQKRPIYWMFDSGKQNGFKALVYMHRWNADTIGNMRVEYLHRMQKVYDKEIERMQEVIDTNYEKKEVNLATKRKEKLQKQLKETKEYDTLIAHLALSRIAIDLDDGVKVNYEKVQTSTDGKVMKVLIKL
ncbi:BREX-1 system adenine-specific DNA-methyltransferase PglX [Peptostreptococcus sp.]|uniref:BREX-1 system adenine-specific DNA-methyltransferase PglX n=1 Tax=Peptostreptococcus sp. TaxID=1262 RepID=UPI001CB01F24|nr:BREX-1 system adenine-specific DNA-methyltransferase PglX [Peptostreptococcus sp.]MBF1049793.1 BREX-1 system adenine-specific DNA-methyltransferase PglX [Peptostreptococcus sp.]